MFLKIFSLLKAVLELNFTCQYCSTNNVDSLLKKYFYKKRFNILCLIFLCLFGTSLVH